MGKILSNNKKNRLKILKTTFEKITTLINVKVIPFTRYCDIHLTVLSIAKVINLISWIKTLSIIADYISHSIFLCQQSQYNIHYRLCL